MKILVTGSNGQLGSELRGLAENSEYVFRFTDVDSLDICDEQAVMKAVGEFLPDVIVNCAAFTAVDAAEDQPELCDRLNRLAPGYLAKATSRYHAGLVHISTDYVFEGTTHVPYKEEDEAAPVTVYGRTKLEGEKLVQTYCPDAVILRTAWLYSPYGKNFVKTMLRLGREKAQLGVVFDQIGSPTYAHDLAAVILQIIGKGLIPGVYHFTDEGVCSWYDFTRMIHQLDGITTCKVLPLHTEEYPVKVARPHYSVLDKTKIKTVYQVEIPYWVDSLKDCLRRLKELEKENN